MPIFYSDTASFSYVTIEGGSGSALFNVSGSAGNLFTIFDSTTDAFSISSGSINIFSIGSPQSVVISGSLAVDIDNIQDVFTAGAFTGNKAGYVEVYVQNLNTGISASSDIVAYADNATESSDFIDMGINGSGVAPGYSFGRPNDSYLFNTGGDLYIGNNTAFYQPGVTSQSLFLFSNASGSPDLTISGSRIGIRKSGSLNATLDVNGTAAISGALAVVGAITGPTIDALSNAISVVSNELSIVESVVNNVSALAPGAVAQVGLQNAINALSNRISAIPGGATSVNPTRFVSTANTLATAALTGISGLTTSVSAGVIYQIEGQILYSISAATGNAFGLVWPTANRVAGVWTGGISVNETGLSTFSTMAFGNFDTGDSNSAVWSATVGAVGLHFIKVEGTIDAQVGGAIFPVARSSVATNTLVIARGSFFRVARIN